MSTEWVDRCSRPSSRINRRNFGVGLRRGLGEVRNGVIAKNRAPPRDGKNRIVGSRPLIAKQLRVSRQSHYLPLCSRGWSSRMRAVGSSLLLPLVWSFFRPGGSVPSRSAACWSVEALDGFVGDFMTGSLTAAEAPCHACSASSRSDIRSVLSSSRRCYGRAAAASLVGIAARLRPSAPM